MAVSYTYEQQEKNLPVVSCSTDPPTLYHDLSSLYYHRSPFILYLVTAMKQGIKKSGASDGDLTLNHLILSWLFLKGWSLPLYSLDGVTYLSLHACVMN